MHVVVVGCGRVGSTVAVNLVEAGHSVCIIDRRADAFRRLGANFAGDTMVGVGFDRDVLRRAGATAESAVAAVTSGDNSNILIARVAREVFGVERVIARIYDPKRASIYERLGISTVASVAWTSERVLRRILPSGSSADWSDPTGAFSIVEREVPSATAGKSIAQIESTTGARVITMMRNGACTLAKPDLLVQQGDVLHIALDQTSLVAVDALLTGGLS